jgi:hypothetical protein
MFVAENKSEMVRKLAKEAKEASKEQDDYDGPESGEGTASDIRAEARWTRKWFWLFMFLIVLFSVAIIVIIIVAMEQTKQNLPKNIDVVLYERPNEPTRLSRHIWQARAVHKYMNWVKRVFVLSPTQSGEDVGLGVTFVPFSGTLSEAFEFMPDIPDIGENAIFLSDMTLPFREVRKEFMFFESNPRMFNIFREQAEVSFFASYLELPTMPTLVTDLVKLKEPPQTWTDLVFREVTEESVTLRTEMNRDVFVVSSMMANSEKQFDKLTDNRPLFATFHVSTADPNPDASNQLLNTFLATEFPN